MGAITEDEATTTGSYRILENIFLEQLGIDKVEGIGSRDALSGSW
jgi:hypothetical protein